MTSVVWSNQYSRASLQRFVQTLTENEALPPPPNTPPVGTIQPPVTPCTHRRADFFHSISFIVTTALQPS